MKTSSIPETEQTVRANKWNIAFWSTMLALSAWQMTRQIQSDSPPISGGFLFVSLGFLLDSLKVTVHSGIWKKILFVAQMLCAVIAVLILVFS